jgi:thiol-disulfide isomerase/thioredoxin
MLSFMHSMSNARPAARLLAALALLCAPAPAQEHGWVGKPAPELEVRAWLNHGEDPRPSLEGLRGQVVLLEFWGTCKKDCMKMEPLAQVLHEKYRDAGLEVLVISYDTVEILRDLITKRAYSVPMGSADMQTYRTWGIPEVPTACVLDARGEILYHGFPDQVEPAIQAALGVKVDARLLLADWFEDDQAGRRTLARLAAIAPRSFDLRAWAAARVGDALSAPSDPPTQPSSGAGELLTLSVAEQRAGEAARSLALVAQLATSAPEHFDLRAWARRTQGESFPITPEELAELLAEQSFERILDAICHRSPTRESLLLAAAHAGFTAHCRKRVPETRAFAKKGLMAEAWLFASVRPRRKQLYWSDMGVAFQSASEGGLAEITIGAETIDTHSVASFVKEHLERVLVASALAAGRAPALERLRERVEGERELLRTYLLERYGTRSDD